jgi:glycosyltransferase involved in cell wall biosynthesis
MAVTGLVSVVISNYNYAKYVGLAIDSVRAQTYPNIEILVVDDGSTDGSLDIIARQARGDGRIRTFFQQNSGQAAATNRGIMEARGEFVAFLDADDIWYPEKLARQMPLFADPRVGVVYSAAKLIDLGGREYAVRKTWKIAKEENFLRHIVLENFIPFSSSVVKKECFFRAGLLNSQYRVCTDYDLWLRIARFYKFDSVEEYLIGYRSRPDSLSGNPVEMFRVAREITEIFYRQNATLFESRFIQMERTRAYGMRVYAFSKAGYVRQALSNLGRLFLLGPFSAHFAKSAAHVAFMLAKQLMKKCGLECTSA